MKIIKECQCDDNNLCDLLKYLKNKTNVAPYLIIKKPNIQKLKHMKGGTVYYSLYRDNKLNYLELKNMVQQE